MQCTIGGHCTIGYGQLENRQLANLSVSDANTDRMVRVSSLTDIWFWSDKSYKMPCKLCLIKCKLHTTYYMLLTTSTQNTHLSKFHRLIFNISLSIFLGNEGHFWNNNAQEDVGSSSSSSHEIEASKQMTESSFWYLWGLQGFLLHIRLSSYQLFCSVFADNAKQQSHQEGGSSNQSSFIFSFLYSPSFVCMYFQWMTKTPLG